MRFDDIVPFAMKCIRLKVDTLHFCIADFAPRWISRAVQSAGDLQSFRRRRLDNEMDDGFVISQGFPTPIRRDEGKRAVPDLVPLACPRWEMTDREGQSYFIREGLQLRFPQAQPPAVAPPPSAVVRVWVAAGWSRWPSRRHHPRAEATANSPVS